MVAFLFIFLFLLFLRLGTFITSLLIDRAGRRWTQAIMYANGALSCICLAFSTEGPTSVYVVLLSIWARISVIASSGATVVVTPELYPTEVRVPGHVVAATLTRIGTVAAPYIAQNNKLGVFEVGLIFGAFNFWSILFALSLPETMGHSVDDILSSEKMKTSRKDLMIELSTQNNVIDSAEDFEVENTVAEGSTSY